MKSQSNKSFILHKDSLSILEQLTDQQAGKLFKAISEYQKDGKIDNLDQITKITITPFLNQFQRDENKYQNSIIQGKLGNLKRYHQEIYQRVISEELNLEEAEKLAYPDKQVVYRPPIVPDGDRSHNVSDSVSVSVSVSDSVSKSINKKDNIIIPSFIKADLWNDFLKLRISLKAKNTDAAIKLLINKLTVFYNMGLDANEAIENSIENSWKGVFEPKSKTTGKSNNSVSDHNSRILQQFVNNGENNE